MIKYFKKALLIKYGKENILVVSDLHLGKGRFDEAGKIISKESYDLIMMDFGYLFENASKNVSKVVILGDIKDNFSSNTIEERNGIVNLIEFLNEKCKEIIIIKGNHDNFVVNLVKENKSVKVYDNYILGEYCFLHGDRDFLDIYDGNIKYWIIGHMHPSIKLSDGNKSENYKCFLCGSYKKKKIVILPSFSEQTFGINVLEGESNLAWKFNIKDFEVKVISDNGKILDFGVVKNIKN